MGWDDAIFTDNVPEDLNCPICHDAMQEPMSACEQGHSYCKGCLVDITRCPECRQDIQGLHKIRAVDKQILGLETRCFDCSWTGPLRERAQHLSLHRTEPPAAEPPPPAAEPQAAVELPAFRPNLHHPTLLIKLLNGLKQALVNNRETDVMFEQIGMALEATEDIEARPRASGQTALYKVTYYMGNFPRCASKLLPLLKRLIEKGADVNVRSTKNHYTPLAAAIWWGSWAAAEPLIDAGAERTFGRLGEDGSGLWKYSVEGLDYISFPLYLAKTGYKSRAKIAGKIIEKYGAA